LTLDARESMMHHHHLAAGLVGLHNLGPLPLPHVQLGVVEAKRLDLDHRMTGLGLWLRYLPNLQHVRPAELSPENRTHKSTLPG
jgi:hypothetical protein